MFYKKSNTFISAIILFSILFFALIQPAFATTSTYNFDISTSLNNDVSLLLLKTLFGGLPLFGGAEDALQHVFKAFNTAVLVFGAIIGTYTGWLGMIGTANEGRMLGGYNSTMTPLRTGIAVAVVLPVVNGYALIHMVIMFLVVSGIFLANYIWGNFVSSDTLANSLAISPLQPEAKQLSRNVLLASICMSAIQKQAELDGDNHINMVWTTGEGKGKRILTNGDLQKMVMANPDKEIKLYAGAYKNANGITDNACGEITIKAFSDGKDGIFSGIDKNRTIQEGINGATGGYASISSGNTTTKVTGLGVALYSAFRIGVDSYNEHKDWMKWLSEMSAEHANATEYLLHQSRIISDSIINHIENKTAEINIQNLNKKVEYEKNANIILNEDGTQSVIQDSNDNIYGLNTKIVKPALNDDEIIKSIDSLAITYQNYIRSKAARSYKDGLMYETLVKNANTYGWAMAGTFYSQMGGMADAINQIAMELPTSTGEIGTRETIKNVNFNSKYASGLNYYLSLSDTFKNDGFRVPTIDNEMQETLQSRRNWVDSGFNLSVLIEDSLANSMNWFISDQENPIMQLKRIGSYMMSTGMAIFTYMMTTMGKMDASGASFLMATFGYTLIAVLFTGGIVMNYIIPMLPVFIWLGMFFGWLVLVMQAMIASPLWVIMHLSPHKGDDFIGAQKNGYMLVLSLVMRPPLMVIGYIFSIIVLIVLGYFINNVFLFMQSMSQVGTNGFATSVFGVFVVPFLYLTLVYIMLKEILNVMHKVPDELLAWFGGGGPQLGGYAHAVNQGSVQTFGMINNNIGTPFNTMRHSLGERANFLENKEGNLNDKLAREQAHAEKINSAIFGGGSMGGSIDDGSIPGANTSFNPDGNSSGSTSFDYGSSAATNWKKAMDDGILSDSPVDILSSKKGMYNAPDNFKDSAMNAAINDVRQQYAEKAQNNDYTPFSNQVLAESYNKHLADRVLGSDLSNDMQGWKNIADARMGAGAGEKLMRGTMRKAMGVANRTGLDYQDVAKQVVGSINDSGKAFLDHKQIDKEALSAEHMDKYGSPDQVTNYKVAGSFVNAWNNTAFGTNSINSTDPRLDLQTYERGSNGGFSYESENLNYIAGKELNISDNSVINK